MGSANAINSANAANAKFTHIPSDIANIISEYAVPLKLLNWINPDKINWKYLSENPAIFEKDLSRITQIREFLTK